MTCFLLSSLVPRRPPVRLDLVCVFFLLTVGLAGCVLQKTELKGQLLKFSGIPDDETLGKVRRKDAPGGLVQLWFYFVFLFYLWERLLAAAGL